MLHYGLVEEYETGLGYIPGASKALQNGRKNETAELLENHHNQHRSV